jgi:hypothetical protein
MIAPLTVISFLLAFTLFALGYIYLTFFPTKSFSFGSFGILICSFLLTWFVFFCIAVTLNLFYT